MWNFVEDGDGGRMMRVTQGESNLQMEHTSFIEGALWAFDVGVPDEDVVFQGSGSNSDSWNLLILDLLQVLDQSLMRISLILFVDGCSQQRLIG